MRPAAARSSAWTSARPRPRASGGRFLRSLRARGLEGVQLVISDAHTGLKAAIAKVFGCPWQRCTVHFLRDMLGHVARAQQPLVSGAIRGIFTAASAAEARERLGQVADQLRPHAPKVARLLEDAEADLLAFYGFPAEHWSKLRSTNPLERVNREIGRRTDVVGIFPNDAALLRLAGMLLVEQNDEWLVGRRYLSESSMTLVLANPPQLKTPTRRRCLSSPHHDRRYPPTITSYTTKCDLTPAARSSPKAPAMVAGRMGRRSDVLSRAASCSVRCGPPSPEGPEHAPSRWSKQNGGVGQLGYGALVGAVQVVPGQHGPGARGTLVHSPRPGPPPGPVNTGPRGHCRGGGWRRIASTTGGARGTARMPASLLGRGLKPLPNRPAW